MDTVDKIQEVLNTHTHIAKNGKWMKDSLVWEMKLVVAHWGYGTNTGVRGWIFNAHKRESLRPLWGVSMEFSYKAGGLEWVSFRWED